MTTQRMLVDLGALGDRLCSVTYEFTPEVPESGRWGPPENYSPGQDEEVEILNVKLTVGGTKVELEPLLTKTGRETLAEEIAELERGEPDEPDEPELDEARCWAGVGR